jgi:flagellar capping protein FliD
LGTTTIAKQLTKRGLKTPGGKSKWSARTVYSILQNEKYKGDALLQKSYTVDFLTKKTKINEGEVPQYYVEHDHEAIIEPQTFEMVQAELKRRNKARKYFSGTSIFSTKIQCAECGGWYGAKVWHSNDKYRRIIYQCNNKFRNKTGCRTPHLTEEEIKAYFVRAMNQIIADKDEIIQTIEEARRAICDNRELLAKRDAMQKEIGILVEMAQNAVERNAQVAQDQEKYQKQYDELINRYDAMKEEYRQLCERIEKRQTRYEQLGQFVQDLKGRDSLLTEFDQSLWCALVDKMVVKDKENVTVVFQDGTEIKA